MEFRVEFVDGLFEVGAVYAVVGADCRRDVFVAEQHLDDLRVFARLEQHTRIGVPQGMEVELVRLQSVLTHKALENRFCSGVCAQFALVVGEHQVVRTDKRLACRALLHPTGFFPFVLKPVKARRAFVYKYIVAPLVTLAGVGVLIGIRQLIDRFVG